MSGQQWRVNSEFTLEQFIEHTRRLFEEKKYLTFSWKVGRQRTNTQNAALHVYCDLLAEALNDAGYEMVISSEVLKSEIHVPWTGREVKERIWRPVQVAVTGEESTTQPSTKEYPVIYETITRHLAKTFGIMVPWPEKEQKAA